MARNLFDENPALRVKCASALARLEYEQGQRCGVIPARKKRARTETPDIRRAFDRAAREEIELRRLKAQHPQYSGLYFKVGGYSVERADSPETTEAAAV